MHPRVSSIVVFVLCGIFFWQDLAIVAYFVRTYLFTQSPLHGVDFSPGVSVLRREGFTPRPQPTFRSIRTPPPSRIHELSHDDPTQADAGWQRLFERGTRQGAKQQGPAQEDERLRREDVSRQV